MTKPQTKPKQGQCENPDHVVVHCENPRPHSHSWADRPRATDFTRSSPYRKWPECWTTEPMTFSQPTGRSRPRLTCCDACGDWKAAHYIPTDYGVTEKAAKVYETPYGETENRREAFADIARYGEKARLPKGSPVRTGLLTEQTQRPKGERSLYAEEQPVVGAGTGGDDVGHGFEEQVGHDGMSEEEQEQADLTEDVGALPIKLAREILARSARENTDLADLIRTYARRRPRPRSSGYLGDGKVVRFDGRNERYTRAGARAKPPVE